MALLGLKDVCIAFGGPRLLDNAQFVIERGERVCLLGRNGAGKSTLLKLLDGTLRPDSGEVVRQTGVTIARMDQEIPGDAAGTIFDVVAAGVGPAGELLAKYHAASHRVATMHDDASLRALDKLHHQLEAANAWQIHTRVETVLEQLSLDAELLFAEASGGRKRQALLARALVRDPDILLLDEPTNHLDIDAVEWMERDLIARGTTLIFVTHDRTFLRNVATRIVELDRGQLVDWGTDYDTYLERKDAALDVEAAHQAEFDKKLAREEVWIRTGIQARRTRNEGRVRSLEALRVERSARQERVRTVRLPQQEAERSGRLVAEARALSFARGERAIVRNANITIMRGDRVGIIGPNGCGKTTLVQLLLVTLTPDSGTVRLGTNLEIAYFDQLREQLDPDATVFDSVANGAQEVSVGGMPRHVNGYLQDFLFPPDRANTPVRALSGGERNRLLLARLFTRTFNLLVLDEPTNDLDIDTLDLLADRLLEYTGTLLLVSHDRSFLDQVATSTIVFEGNARVGEYAGGYTDWVRQRNTAAANAAAHTAANDSVRASTAPSVNTSRSTTRVSSHTTNRAGAVHAKPRKLNYAEKKELDKLPDDIDKVEQERATVLEQLSDPAVLRDGVAVVAAHTKLTTLDATLAQLLARWEQLETIASGE